VGSVTQLPSTTNCEEGGNVSKEISSSVYEMGAGIERGASV
jgi:hypothetical protein